ncbi:MAG: hypothetical protein NVSMB64_01030 [Candidatus Velthaea sp.]
MIVFTALAAFRRLGHMRNANEINAFTAIVARRQTPEVNDAIRYIVHDGPALVRDPLVLQGILSERADTTRRVKKSAPTCALFLVAIGAQLHLCG